MSKLLPIHRSKRPLAELHVHAEGGTLTQETICYLADKNQLPVPKDIFADDGLNLTFKEGDFLDFLRVYDVACKVIAGPEDVTEVIYRYLKRCAEEGAIYVEMTGSPDHCMQDRVDFDGQQSLVGEGHASELNYPLFVDAVAKAIDQAREDFGIEARMLIVLLRHNGVAGCMPVLEAMLADPHPYIVGLNLAGDEVAFPAELFHELFLKAKQAGLKVTAHVGEHSGPEFIRKAIDTLQLDRVGHGVTCIKDLELMDYIKNKGIGLEICPTSNVALKVFRDYQSHPFKQIFDAGILCSINSDDPTYFDTSLLNEYEIAKREWNLSEHDLWTICRDTIEMSFAEESLKQKLLAYLDVYKAEKL